MPCRSPRKQYHRKDDAWTFKRFPVTNVTASRELPCGVCRDCRIRRQREWKIRSYHEAQLHQRSCWVNPTFAENPVTLSRKPFRLFFRRMRKAGLKFRYFGCGEYGEKLSRPHGHICLFGINFQDDAYYWRVKNGITYYRSPLLENFWTWGNIEHCPLTPGAAGYTAGYTSKKINGPLAEDIDPDTGLKHYEKIHPETGEIITIKPEFVMASTKPAIGKEWLKLHYGEIYPADSVVMDGKEYPVPRKYDEWLKTIDLDLYEVVQAKRLAYLETQPKLTQERRDYEARARDSRRYENVRSFDNNTGAPSR